MVGPHAKTLEAQLEKLSLKDGDLLIARGDLGPEKLIAAGRAWRGRKPDVSIIFLHDGERLEHLTAERLAELGLARVR